MLFSLLNIGAYKSNISDKNNFTVASDKRVIYNYRPISTGQRGWNVDIKISYHNKLLYKVHFRMRLWLGYHYYK